MNDRSTTESNGRDGAGRFGKGNKIAKGNPFARRVAQLRSVLLGAVTDADLKEVVLTLVQQAKGGDVASIKELLQRLLGPAESVDTLARLEELEQRIEQLLKVIPQ